jgi:hypothetical protein
MLNAFPTATGKKRIRKAFTWGTDGESPANKRLSGSDSPSGAPLRAYRLQEPGKDCTLLYHYSWANSLVNRMNPKNEW